MKFVEIKTMKVIRTFRHGTYTWDDGRTSPSVDAYRDCGIGCTCQSQILKAIPGAKLAESKSLCFNDMKKQGISEVAGSAVAIIEGPDEWSYEVSAKLIGIATPT